MTEQQDAAACIHACQDGCGRTYDVIIVQAIDGSTLFYCIPCLQQFVYQMTRAMLEPNDPQVQEVVEGADLSGVMLVDPDATGYTVRGFSDPVAEDDFDMDEADEE